MTEKLDCQEADECVACPLPVCRYDDPDGYSHLLAWRRANIEAPIAIASLYGGQSEKAVAAKFGYSPTSVERFTNSFIARNNIQIIAWADSPALDKAVTEYLAGGRISDVSSQSGISRPTIAKYTKLRLAAQRWKPIREYSEINKPGVRYTPGCMEEGQTRVGGSS